MVRFCAVLTVIALTSGMAGCVDTPSPAQNLEVRTWYDLDAVRNNLDGNHILMNGLDSTTVGYAELAGPTANEGNGWEPIGVFVSSLYGNHYDGLAGTFDGQGYDICDLFINVLSPSGTGGDIGLFGEVEDEGVIEDVGVVNATLIAGCSVGGLVGHNIGIVRNCHCTGTVNTLGVAVLVVSWDGIQAL